MLQQRQLLLDHLKECIEKAHQSHIPCSSVPIGYLECPLHNPDDNYSPHIQLDQLTSSGEVTCPKSDCKVVPKDTYTLLFTSSLASGEFIISYEYSYIFSNT